jgi:hypothetical protein
MNRKQLAELLKYASPYSILVVSWKGEVLELRCPFKVKVKNDIGVLVVGGIAEVEQVKISAKLITVFVIDGNAFYYYHFDIIID